MGGRLSYMQVMYLTIYPQLSLTPNFVLGMVVVSGLSTPFAFGVMSLGGALSTFGLLLLYSNSLRKKLQTTLASRIFKKVPP
jgi:hypothetical protein